MRYLDGNEARIGDTIRLDNGQLATVVFSVDTCEFSEDFPESELSYLASGIMIRTESGELIHYEEESNQLVSLEARETL